MILQVSLCTPKVMLYDRQQRNGLLLRPHRLVGAEGLGGEIVSGDGEGAGAAAAADPAVFADAALAVVVVEVAHLFKKLRLVPYL